MLDDSSTVAAVLEAALNRRNFDYDYVSPAAPKAKRRRHYDKVENATRTLVGRYSPELGAGHGES